LHTLGAASGAHTVVATLTAPPSVPPVRFTTNAIAQAGVQLVAEMPVEPDYGIHDTYVRNGIAFVCAWNTGVIIYDVGNGIRGGSPSHPVEVSRILPPPGIGSVVRGAIHNAWWFHNPASGEARYLFLGQEGPGILGSSSRGDIYVVDVRNLASPQVVAQFTISGSGTHNFWIDEPAQTLYAAYYDAGVVALDVSGTLSGNLASRQLARIEPGSPTATYVWGVQVANGAVYASDMLSGLWQLAPASGGLAVQGGGRNVLERYTSDLWVSGQVAYTGTWGSVPRRDSLGNLNPGDVIKIWSLGGGGAPVLSDSIKISGVQTISDLEVTQDGRLLIITSERGSAAGFFAFSLANPLAPQQVGSMAVSSGLHTGTIGVIGGRTFLFGARNPPGPALMVFDVSSLVP
jgi:hypothetical protein